MFRMLLILLENANFFHLLSSLQKLKLKKKEKVQTVLIFTLCCKKKEFYIDNTVTHIMN